jgi:molecular chaperone DnaK
MSDTIVGIDLGTTNSLIGTVIEGKPELFADASGSELLPSVVGADQNGRLLVGRTAKNRRLLDPAGTVSSVKRLMGTSARCRAGDRELSPSQVSALILGSLLDRAQQKLGVRPERAVITVPAYFNDAQRQATRDAGELAGLAVERLVNEPTAAALTYRTGQEQIVLVYDLGGGTFDVSVLERDEGLLEVRASRGDTRLGGDDIDLALTNLVLDRLGPSRSVVEADPRAMTRLLEAVERAKIALSDRLEVRLFDPFLAGEVDEGLHLDLVLTREDVNNVARPFVQRTLDCIDAALHDAQVSQNALDRVLLVGGASKMPLVRSLVASHLGRPAQLDLDADRAVALGASLLAARIAGMHLSDVLVDITPHTLSIGVYNPDADIDDEDSLVAAPVIPRGTVVPVVRKKSCYTLRDNQPALDVPIAQGEWPRLAGNTRLGCLHVEPLPPSPANSPVEVTFQLDLSGVLHVSACHLASGCHASAHIADSPYSLTAQHRTAARAEVDAFRARPGEHASPAQSGATESDLSLANAMLSRARRMMERPDADPALFEQVRIQTAALADAVGHRNASVANLVHELSDALLDLV